MDVLNDIDPDDTELAQTPPDVVAVLGFDPKEYSAIEASHVLTYSAIEAGGSTASKGCLMAEAPDDLAARIQKWGKDNIPDAVVDTTEGREDETHCTSYYGFDTGFDVERLQDAIKEFGAAELKLGKVSRFECPDYDVLKISVTSPDLVEIHKLIDSEFDGDGVTPSQHTYSPHVTISYVLKGACKELDGRTDFVGDSFTVDKLLYSLPGKTGRQWVNLTSDNT